METTKECKHGSEQMNDRMTHLKKRLKQIRGE
jgi:hypothetical protein